MRRACVAAALAALGAWTTPSAHAALPPPHLTEQQAVARFLATPKVADWVGRYSKRALDTEGKYDETYRDWTVKVWAEPAGEIAFGRVDDLTGGVEEAWTGPQVAWPMARGGGHVFGGKLLNSLPVWLGLCAVFVLGLADLRRLWSIRNLDLLVLSSLTVSFWFFNHGRIFTSVPLIYPVLFYLLGRMLWIGLWNRATTVSRPVWPVWVLAAATVFLAGFRVGLDLSHPTVIDVGYAGVIGAQRIAGGEAPYGHFPASEGTSCGPTDRDGNAQLHVQPNGRCEKQNEHGDTYGPLAYEAYLPGYGLFGWKQGTDPLLAARFTAVAFDLLCMLGLVLVGLRFGDRRLAVSLAFAWAAYPFTQYVANANANDAVVAAFLVLGLWLASSDWGRGGLLAAASWTKFAPLVLVPLWATYPTPRPRRVAAFATAFVVATLAAFSILLLEPSVVDAVKTFWHRTIPTQVDRHSPFSLWDWRQYHAGLPDLHVVQRALEALLVAAAVALAFRPRVKSPLQLAALSAALLIGFEVVLTHWFYLYVVWFFPFVAVALLAGEAATCRAEETRPRTPAAPP